MKVRTMKKSVFLIACTVGTAILAMEYGGKFKAPPIKLTEEMINSLRSKEGTPEVFKGTSWWVCDYHHFNTQIFPGSIMRTFRSTLGKELFATHQGPGRLENCPEAKAYPDAQVETYHYQPLHTNSPRVFYIFTSSAKTDADQGKKEELFRAAREGRLDEHITGLLKQKTAQRKQDREAREAVRAEKKAADEKEESEWTIVPQEKE